LTDEQLLDIIDIVKETQIAGWLLPIQLFPEKV
jgi:hypothetical protein